MTCLVEMPIVVALVRGLGWRPLRRPGVITVAWLLQFTHPVLWVVNPADVLGLALAELAVVAVEGAGLYWWAISRTDAPRTFGTLERALLVVFIANASSFLVGLALRFAQGFAS